MASSMLTPRLGVSDGRPFPAPETNPPPCQRSDRYSGGKGFDRTTPGGLGPKENPISRIDCEKTLVLNARIFFSIYFQVAWVSSLKTFFSVGMPTPLSTVETHAVP
jgi:hypothetical protein